MSTKRLARTVLEGGRRNYDKFMRRYHHRQDRRTMRDYLREVQKDTEVSEGIIEPISTRHPEELTDKLSPVFNWIDSQVGKPWSKVRRLIKETFDTRSLAGYHVVKTHILGEIANCGEQENPSYYHNGDDTYYVNIQEAYYVDKHDILRINPDHYRHNRKRYLRYHEERKLFSDEARAEVVQWLEHRLIRQEDGILYWSHRKTEFIEFGGPIRILVWSNIQNASKGNYFQYRMLDNEEARYFFSLPKWVQDHLIH